MTPTRLPGQGEFRPLTWDDLQQLDDEGLRYEIVDGVLLVSPAPNLNHQRTVLNLGVLFKNVLPPELEVFIAPTDWYVTHTTVFEPDLLVVRRADLTNDRRIEGTPVLLVEVLSPSTSPRDLGLKKLRYQAEGVPWYWVLDPAEPELTVFRLEDDRYVEEAVVAGDDVYQAREPFSTEVVPSKLLA